MLRRDERVGGEGFTLMEVLMVVVVIAVLAVIALPNFRKTMERGYWREATDLLMTVYAGEETYFSLNDKYYDVNEAGGMTEWRIIYMDDPNLAAVPVAFKVTSPGPAFTTFTATATRNGGPCNGQTQTINQLRTLGGGNAAKTCWAGCGC
jgi:prepilin-type N-terminal cleavage/methylation domain-containing protein